MSFTGLSWTRTCAHESTGEHSVKLVHLALVKELISTLLDFTYIANASGQSAVSLYTAQAVVLFVFLCCIVVISGIIIKTCLFS